MTFENIFPAIISITFAVLVLARKSIYLMNCHSELIKPLGLLQSCSDASVCLFGTACESTKI
jgi:hypothetical protein